MECFITNSNAVEQRLDCHYYQPEFVELENRISKLTDKKFGDYIISIAGGATPNKNEVDRYYSDSENGVPFLRVQNVTPEGLKLENLVFINKETHNNMLKRSQVKEHYLITKITGVGRMAVSSVAPSGFEGNINQHLVAIKTESSEVSRVLAAFLNSDIGERLASRRSTGGTRPALDYEALKTIPIVFKPRIVDIMQSAYEPKRRKKREAQELLDSIDEYVLGELGIISPEPEKGICYPIESKVIKNRIDPEHYIPVYTEIANSIEEGKYPLRRMNEVAERIVRGFEPQAGKEYDYIQLGCIDRLLGRITQTLKITMPNIPARAQQVVKHNEILFSTSLPQMGAHALVEKEHDNSVVSSGFTIIRATNCNADYLLAVIRLNLFLNLCQKYLTGAGLFKTISNDDLFNLRVPHPPIAVQENIASIIKKRIQKAETLQQEADTEVDKAKAEVERLILGNEGNPSADI